MKNLFIFFILFLIPFVNADSNGIWVDAKDIRGGVFGSDETNNDFSFVSNLGIGISNPQSRLHVFGSQPSIIIDSQGSNEASWLSFYSQGNKFWSIGQNPSWDNVNHDFYIYRSSSLSGNSIEGLTIDGNNGNVGIGKTNPSVTLDVNGNIQMNNELVATRNWVNTNDDVLNEAQVDSYVSNNGYLQSGFSGDLIQDNSIDSSELETNSVGNSELVDNINVAQICDENGNNCNDVSNGFGGSVDISSFTTLVRGGGSTSCSCATDEIRTGCTGRQTSSYDTYAASGSKTCYGERVGVQCICLKIN